MDADSFNANPARLRTGVPAEDGFPSRPGLLDQGMANDADRPSSKLLEVLNSVFALWNATGVVSAEERGRRATPRSFVQPIHGAIERAAPGRSADHAESADRNPQERQKHKAEYEFDDRVQPHSRIEYRAACPGTGSSKGKLFRNDSLAVGVDVFTSGIWASPIDLSYSRRGDVENATEARGADELWPEPGQDSRPVLKKPNEIQRCCGIGTGQGGSGGVHGFPA